MKDPMPDPMIGDKFWLTTHFTGNYLFRYDNIEKFRNNDTAIVYELKDIYMGTGRFINIFKTDILLSFFYFIAMFKI